MVRSKKNCPKNKSSNQTIAIERKSIYEGLNESIKCFGPLQTTITHPSECIGYEKEQSRRCNAAFGD